ncbi:MAG: histidine phosphatase family protein [Oscillospiraceae bacterium]|jgi:alpha-ribazole phosphatase|nr:histidine phosphatase family protein [Oscillospiraceae bacterium]
MISYKIHLLRTGSTNANPWKRYVGQSDIPLCDKGRESLRQLRGEFTYPPVSAVYVSPLSRCSQTAEILYPGYSPIVVEDIKDMNLGAFEGKTFDELRGDEAFARWLADSFRNTPPGGEEAEAFTARAVKAFDGIVRDMMEKHTESAAVVTHGGVVMALMAAIAIPRLPLHQWAANNGCGYTLLTNTQLWMRDRCAEVFSFLPDQSIEDDTNMYGLYFNE